MPREVIDKDRAIAEYVKRWRAIPADQRTAIVNEQARLRLERSKGHARQVA